MQPNIYLDIDGTLIRHDGTGAAHADEFVEYVVVHFPDTVYWLSTHCKGNAEHAVRVMSAYLKERTIDLFARKIRPTEWNIAKTEAIDLDAPFLWFDDTCMGFERAELSKRGLLGNWIEVDLDKNPDRLFELINSFPVPVRPLAH